MTITEAKAKLQILRGYAKEGSLAFHYSELAELYMAVCKKTIRKCNCKDRYNDALIEIYHALKATPNIEDVMNTKARLVNGVVLQFADKIYTNANLTDDAAREFLSKFPQRIDWFAVLPAEAVEETAEEAIEGEQSDETEEVEQVPTKRAKRAKKAKK